MVADGLLVFYRYFPSNLIFDPRQWSHLVIGLLRGALRPSVVLGVFGLVAIAGAWLLRGRNVRERPRR